MPKQPAFQFYPGDWLRDPNLQSAAFASQGIWMKCLCFMWEADDRGVLRGSREALMRLIGCGQAEFDGFIADLERYRFGDVATDGNGDVTLRNRRMVAAEKVRKDTANRVARFRERAAVTHRETPLSQPDNSASSSSSSSSRIKDLSHDSGGKEPERKRACTHGKCAPDRCRYAETVKLAGVIESVAGKFRLTPVGPPAPVVKIEKFAGGGDDCAAGVPPRVPTAHPLPPAARAEASA